MKRQLGQSNIELSPIGLGTWAIGGAMASDDGSSSSWGHVDDDEAVHAIRQAMEMGITFFDTANNYGCGHAERLLGKAIAGRRDEVVLATKFGYPCRPGSRIVLDADVRETAVRQMLAQSLKNLGTDRIDLYQLHVYDLSLDEALRLRDLLETLVAEGQIRGYGWSMNDPERAASFVDTPNCIAIQHHFNLFERTQTLLELCQMEGVSSIARGPLGMGLLTGKYSRGTRMPADDFRSDWDCENGRQGEQLTLLAEVRDILTSEGHTLPQAALAWLLTYSDNIIPIPGFKTVAQVQDSVGVLEKGRLSRAQMEALAERLTPGTILIR